MKTYYWPLVLIGATLMMMGPMLPWFMWSGGFSMLGEPTSGYTTGFHWGGFISALGGVALLFIVLFESGESDGHGSLIVSALCGLLIVGGVCSQMAVICGDCPTYSPAFGLFVSLLGVALGIIGSRMEVHQAAVRSKKSVAILIALEFSILFFGLVLITRPAVGVQLGVWDTPKKLPPCLLNVTGTGDTPQNVYCRGLLATEAARPTATLAPLWQQWGLFRTLPPIPTLDASKCIEWNQVDQSYIGKYACVKGVVATSPGPTYFSTEPHTFYVNHIGGFHKGDCLIVTGAISADSNQTLRIDPQRMNSRCPPPAWWPLGH